MTIHTQDLEELDVAGALCAELVTAGFGPFLGTPCGILSPMFVALDELTEILTVAREDNAVGMAAGASLAGRLPAVLMQNSGFGQSINAIASLVEPYRIPMLFVISMRGTYPDPTEENLVMGRLTEPLLEQLGVEAVTLAPDVPPAPQVARVHRIVAVDGRPAALLVPPAIFGWRA
jgi:sulfopyruvate decarboxylase subunit alpha/phosphonopyruvate decarboxylase